MLTKEHVQQCGFEIGSELVGIYELDGNHERPGGLRYRIEVWRQTMTVSPFTARAFQHDGTLWAPIAHEEWIASDAADDALASAMSFLSERTRKPRERR